MNSFMRTLVVSGMALLLSAPSRAVSAELTRPQTGLEKAVRHELVMLPYYNVFDNLSYKVEGNKVTLTGQVVRPTLKSDAANVVKRIEGVDVVDNQIEVLPLSPFDDQTRRAVYQSVFGFAGLGRYTLGAIPSVHIIVKNGNVTLEGAVMNEMDRNMANIRANSVSGVFSVTNNLVVDKKV